MIFIAGISIAVLIEFLLISKKNKNFSDKILTVWMLIISVQLLLFYLTYSEEVYNYPFLIGIEMPIPLLQGVMLYLYVGSMTNQLPKNSLWSWIHFLPTIGFFIYLTLTFFTLSTSQKIYVFQHEGFGFETFSIILLYAIIISGITYVIWSLFLLRKHRHAILDTFSDVEKINLQWLHLLTLGLGAIWIIVIFEDGNVYTFFGVVVFVFLIAFFGIKQVRIITPNEIVLNTSKQKEKYAKSGLKEESSSELYSELTALMMEENLYKNGDLSVGDLSLKLGVHSNHLSQVINEQEGKNFYDFVNNYRIDEFKNLVADPKNHHYTLLALAYDCGFNSKSAFNRYFKKVMNQTPSQYFTLVTKEEAPL